MNLEDSQAIGEILTRFESELRNLARRRMRSQPRSLLQTTALVNSACRRIIGASEEAPPNWTDEAHFLRVAARAMRSVLTDYARKRDSAKRSRAVDPRPVEEHEVADDQSFGGRMADVLTLNEILDEQAKIDPAHARLVELRYFGGLTLEETAKASGVGVKKVKLACAQLKHLMRRWESDEE